MELRKILYLDSAKRGKEVDISVPESEFLVHRPSQSLGIHGYGEQLLLFIHHPTLLYLLYFYKYPYLTRADHLLSNAIH